jgi:acetyltransferase-like isoleucine patch superfamily enzyme
MLKAALRKFAWRLVMNKGKGFASFNRYFGATGYEFADYLRAHGGFQSIGKDVLIVPGIDVTDPAYVRIGNNVCLSRCALIGHDGSVGILSKAYGVKLDRVGKIDIQDNVFIGYGAIVLPGVTIGSNVVVAAGAVVASSVEPGSVVGGVPAKRLMATADLVARMADATKQLPWWDLIEKRDGDFDPVLEPELVRRRVELFYGSSSR